MSIAIIESVLNDILRRIKILESQIEFLKQPKSQTKPKEDKSDATPAQLNYIRMLGGTYQDGITREQAGEKIDSLLEEKKMRELAKQMQEMEPEQVDTDDAGLDSEGLM